MNESEIQLFLRVHGESARPFIEKASLLGYIYIFPEPNFGEAVQIALKELMSKRYSWANYVVDFQVFRKPPSRVFIKRRFAGMKLLHCLNLARVPTLKAVWHGRHLEKLLGMK